MAAGPEPGNEAWDVFIAYARADRDQATELWGRLEGRGLKCFIDHKRLKPGDKWIKVLPEVLKASSVVVTLVSDSTEDAYYAEEEIALAIDVSRRENLRVAPVYLGDEIEPPYGLRQLHGLFVSDGWDHIETQLADLFARDDDGRTADERQIWCERVPPWSRAWRARDDLLRALDQASGASMLGQSAEAFAVSGAGGIGKTTLAAMYAHTRRDQFDLVWWVRSETDVLLTQDLAELADELGIAPADSVEDTAGLVRSALASRDTPWLVVFDNARTADELKPWIPAGTPGRVIITSRSTGWEKVSDPLDVPVMNDEEAAEFLAYRVRDTNPVAAEETEAIAELVEYLQGFPLALEHAGAYVARNDAKRFSAYLDRYRDGGFRDDPKFATWKISIDEAVEQEPLCDPLMKRLSFCAPDDIPEVILADLTESKYALEDALDVLDAVSLIRRKPGAIDIHRVVQDAARRGATVGDLNGLLTALKAAYSDATGPAHRALHEALASHAIATVDHRDEAGVDGNSLWWVLDDVVIHLASSGQFAASAELAETAVRLAESHQDVHLLNAFASRVNLADSLRLAGRVDAAVELGEQVVDDYVEHAGDRDPGTLAARESLAMSYLHSGRIDEAIDLQTEVVSSTIAVLGERDPSTLTSQANLASSYRAAGRIDEAVALDEKVLHVRAEVFGEADLATVMARGNLASSLWAAGRVNDAIALDETVVSDLAELQGAQHPMTLTARGNLAASYWSVGRIQDAIALEERVLTDTSDVLGADHPHTLTAIANLAHSHHAAGQFARATELLGSAIEKAISLDHEHPYLATWRGTMSDWISE